jgi:nondiscriminating aspartyl-tRNA synthetase
MQRTIISETINNVGKKVKVAGWVNARRDHGKIAFLDLRDRSGILQVFVPKPEMIEGVQDETVIEIEGTVQERPMKMINQDIETGKVELSAEAVRILAKSETLPFDIRDLNSSLPTILDFRPITLRNEKINAIFRIRTEIVNSFRKTLLDQDFFEFQPPTIVPANAEGGAEVFHIDYYDKDAYLAQSPQLYKQMLVGAFERVFAITNIFRAEPSLTTRHLAEYVSMDAEMGFIDSWEDLMNICEILIKNIFSDLEKNCARELKLLGAKLPEIKNSIPRIKMREAQKIILKRTKRDNTEEPDLQPEDEKEICEYAKEKYGSELVFITHYPVKKRPFYTFADPEDKEYTMSFDLLCRGLEITTGGRRINEYSKLVENIEKWGNKPEAFDFYLQAFKYGMPPEGGFAFGLERVTKQILGLENLREASFFPRDMERIDQSLSKEQPKKYASVKNPGEAKKIK